MNQFWICKWMCALTYNHISPHACTIKRSDHIDWNCLTSCHIPYFHWNEYWMIRRKNACAQGVYPKLIHTESSRRLSLHLLSFNYSFSIFRFSSEYQESFLDFVASLFSKSEEPDLRDEIVALKREIVQNAPGGCTFKTYFIQKEKCITLMESKTNVDENHATTGR